VIGLLLELILISISLDKQSKLFVINHNLRSRFYISSSLDISTIYIYIF
jgi:hypothetical protein